MWTFISRLNERHAMWAWISLTTVMLADFWVFICAKGIITGSWI
jgi:hypothetical protein